MRKGIESLGEDSDMTEIILLFLSWHYQTCFHVAISYGYEHRADYMYGTLHPPYIVMYKLKGCKQKQKLPNCCG